jgi:ubiquinone/menaquinone biosynthesis C-methylase UbiE
MRIQDAYSRWSSTYDSDRNLTRDLDELATRQTLSDRTYKTILELGCGTGKNTAFLSGIAKQVVALDFSSGMLQQAKSKIESNNVGFAVADLTKPWPCKTGSCELIVANLVLEHIQDLNAIFSEASKALETGGQFFISELHPFRQYQGNQANFRSDEGIVVIEAFMHHVSDFVDAASNSGLHLRMLKEWWHEDDQNKLPRLISFIFEKPTSADYADFK